MMSRWFALFLFSASLALSLATTRKRKSNLSARPLGLKHWHSRIGTGYPPASAVVEDEGSGEPWLGRLSPISQGNVVRGTGICLSRRMAVIGC